MRFAYADPPYLGMGKRMYGALHADAADCDRPEWHRDLVNRLVSEYPDGWALSLSSPSLRIILPFCPEKARVMSWVKPYASSRPGVRVIYTWEPVILMGGRKGQEASQARDSLVCNPWGVTPQERRVSNPGERKPDTFCFWLFEVFGAQPGDEFADLFPGSGAVGRAWIEWQRTARLYEKKTEPLLPLAAADPEEG